MLDALVAAGGSALIVSGRLGSGLAIPVLPALIGFPLLLAEGAVIIKLLPQGSSVVTNAVAFSIGALILAVLSLLTGETWSLPSAPSTWAAFGYLVVIGAVAANYLWLVGRHPGLPTAFC